MLCSDSNEALYLPCGCVSPEIGKLSCKPVVDLVESQLSVWGLQNGLKDGERNNRIQRRAQAEGREAETGHRRDLHDV